jgi:hypothetical protein
MCRAFLLQVIRALKLGTGGGPLRPEVALSGPLPSHWRMPAFEGIADFGKHPATQRGWFGFLME